jgi:hypothetical protein
VRKPIGKLLGIFSKDKKLTNLMNNYCMNYFTNFGGGVVDRIGRTRWTKFFYGQ